MAKNKEIERIALAIKNKDKKEILWAINYSKIRLQIAPTTYIKKHWEKTIRELSDALPN